MESFLPQYPVIFSYDSSLSLLSLLDQEQSIYLILALLEQKEFGAIL